MTTCKQASELLSRAQDRPLPALQRLRLRMHLLICERCRRVAGHFEFLRRAIRRHRDLG